MFKTIIVGADGSAGSEPAIATAAELAGQSGAKLVLAHVSEHTVGKGGGDIQADEGDLEAALRKRAEDLSASLEVRDSVLGGPAHAIADLAAELGADLIVVGTRGHSPVSGLLLGSVAQRLLHLAKSPVLVVPSPG